jgi:hypothetical protein
MSVASARAALARLSEKSAQRRNAVLAIGALAQRLWAVRIEHLARALYRALGVRAGRHFPAEWCALTRSLS